MIKMKALRSANIGIGGEKVRRGREFDAPSEQRATELEAHGLAYRLQVKAMTPPSNKMEPPPQNKAAAAGPLGSPGGKTGAEEPALSSPPDPPQRRRQSARSKDQDLLS